MCVCLVYFSVLKKFPYYMFFYGMSCWRDHGGGIRGAHRVFLFVDCSKGNLWKLWKHVRLQVFPTKLIDYFVVFLLSFSFIFQDKFVVVFFFFNTGSRRRRRRRKRNTTIKTGFYTVTITEPVEKLVGYVSRVTETTTTVYTSNKSKMAVTITKELNNISR